MCFNELKRGPYICCEICANPPKKEVPMAGGEIITTSQATAEVFFTAFKSLKGNEKEAFLEKVLRNPALRQDIIDIALIEEAKKVKGKPIAAKEYFQRRRKSYDK